MDDHESDQRIVAYHEAGHDVMAIACGFAVTEINIADSENGAGYVRYRMPQPIVAETAKKAALVYAAGLAADMLLAQVSGKNAAGRRFPRSFQRPKDGKPLHFPDG